MKNERLIVLLSHVFYCDYFSYLHLNKTRGRYASLIDLKTEALCMRNVPNFFGVCFKFIQLYYFLRYSYHMQNQDFFFAKKCRKLRLFYHNDSSLRSIDCFKSLTSRHLQKGASFHISFLYFISSTFWYLFKLSKIDTAGPVHCF